MNAIITRFAPSPTGNLHIGGVRTALLNYVITQKAKKKFPKSKFLLRIEDTDKIRSNNEFKNNIIDELNWMGFHHDDEPYIQSERIKRHQEVALDLLENNKAFKCICKPAELEKKRNENTKNHTNVKRLCTKCENNHDVQKLKNGYVIRIKIPNSENITLTDLVQGGITVENQEIDNFIILRNDGTPTYMLAVVVDDFDMGVNLIIRGDDHLNNSFRQFYIYKNMHWPIPQYAHIPLIHGEDGKKLSKRHGALNICEFKEKGYLQKAIINNLILLGWAPSNDDEIISLEEIINNFEIKNLSKSSSIFNYDKLNYFNSYYLRKDANVKYCHDYYQTNPQLKTFYRKDKEKLKRIFNIYKTKINYYKELENISSIYFEENFVTKKNILLNKEFKELLKKCIILLENLDLWENMKIEDLIKNFINTNKIKFISFGKPLRFTLINLENGPAVSDIFFILGKKNSILRLNNYIKG